MARKRVERELTIEELVPLYGEQNTQCNALKKVVSDLNSKLKNAIKKAKQENKDIEVDGWKCSLSITENSDMNEERLLEFAKTHKLKIIKTKEYIDFDELERLIYTGKIPNDVLVEMESCKDSSVRETLRINKLK